MGGPVAEVVGALADVVVGPPLALGLREALIVDEPGAVMLGNAEAVLARLPLTADECVGTREPVADPHNEVDTTELAESEAPIVAEDELVRRPLAVLVADAGALAEAAGVAVDAVDDETLAKVDGVPQLLAERDGDEIGVLLLVGCPLLESNVERVIVPQSDAELLVVVCGEAVCVALCVIVLDDELKGVADALFEGVLNTDGETVNEGEEVELSVGDADAQPEKEATERVAYGEGLGDMEGDGAVEMVAEAHVDSEAVPLAVKVVAREREALDETDDTALPESDEVELSHELCEALSVRSPLFVVCAVVVVVDEKLTIVEPVNDDVAVELLNCVAVLQIEPEDPAVGVPPIVVVGVPDNEPSGELEAESVVEADGEIVTELNMDELADE